MAKRERKKLTEAQKRAHKRYYEKNREEIIRKQVIANRKRQQVLRQKKSELRQARIDEWAEIGWIIAKMNVHASISQEDIYELLGGMVSKKSIRFWCAIGKKLDRLGKHSISPCLPNSLISAALLPKSL